MSASRERFEAWCDDEGVNVERQASGVYAYAPARVDWRTWQAAERDALERAAKVCEWKQDTDYETEIWHTSCGEAFVFNEGGPEENFLKFCCYCGGRLTAIRALARKE